MRIQTVSHFQGGIDRVQGVISPLFLVDVSMSFNYLVIGQTQDLCLSPESTIATGTFTPHKLLNKMSPLYNTGVKKDCFHFYRQTLR